MRVQISSTPSVKYRFSIDFSDGKRYYDRRINSIDVEPSDSITMVESGAETIKGMFGKLPEDSTQIPDMLSKSCDKVFDMKMSGAFSDEEKLSEYLDMTAAANYLCNMMISGEPGFKFVYHV